MLGRWVVLAAFFRNARLSEGAFFRGAAGSAFFRCAVEYGKHSLIVFRGASFSVLSLRACIRLNSIFLFFLAFGSRSQVRHLIALLFLVPPAAKEGKGDCEFHLCPPWILLLPLCNAGHFVPGGGYGVGLRSIELSISGGRFYGSAVDMVALLPCLDHAIALLGRGRSLFDCERGLTFLLNGLLPRFRSFAWQLWLWAQRRCVREPGS